jgi:DNA-binding transcriptional ArsR family regulator
MSTVLAPERLLAQASSLLAAMANAKRMYILEIISREEISVGALAVMAGLSQSALSQHLGRLRSGKLVQTRRDAQTVFYKCDSDEVRRMLHTLSEIFGTAPHQTPTPSLPDKRSTVPT